MLSDYINSDTLGADHPRGVTYSYAVSHPAAGYIMSGTQYPNLEAAGVLANLNDEFADWLSKEAISIALRDMLHTALADADIAVSELADAGELKLMRLLTYDSDGCILTLIIARHSRLYDLEVAMSSPEGRDTHQRLLELFRSGAQATLNPQVRH